MIKKIFTTSVIFLFGIASYASATPSLGFQPIENINDPYEAYLGQGALPSDGSIEMTAWFGRDNGPLAGEDLTADIWVLTNSVAGDDFTLGGVDFKLVTIDPDKKVVAYHDLDSSDDPTITYYGVNLGNVVTGSGWYQAPSTFSPGDFRFNTATLTISNAAEGDWFFALADFGVEGFYQTGTDEFSPQTTSSSVPEPSSMLLFGTGLVGLAGIARRKSKK